MGAPSTIVDRYGRPASLAWGFYESTGQRGSSARRNVPVIADDSRQTLTSYDRTWNLGYARRLYVNVGMVKGGIDDMARYSIGSGLRPQSQVTEKKIAREYEQWFSDWSARADLAGKFCFEDLQRLGCKATDCDGDIGFEMVDEGGEGRLNPIEGHRITSDGTKNNEGWFDGVRTDRYGRPLSYRVEVGEKQYKEIDAFNFIHLFDPDRLDQDRGMTSLVHAINNTHDILDILGYEKVGVKMASAIGLAIFTQSGEADAGSSFIEQGFKAKDTGGLALDTFQAGMIPRLKPGEDIRQLMSNRPNPTFQGFLEFFIRDFAIGLGLPFEFVWNAAGLNGTAQRLILSKAQRRFEERQMMIIRRFCNRVWTWVIAKAIKRKFLPPHPDWRYVRWQGPAKITVDVGREANANRDDMKFGVRTIAEDAGERGLDWREDVRDQVEVETRDLLDRAKKLSADYGITIQEAINLLRQPAASPPAPPAKAAPQETP